MKFGPGEKDSSTTPHSESIRRRTAILRGVALAAMILTIRADIALAQDQSDADQVITSLQAQFNTDEHHKLKNNGISETYKREAEILGQNTSWGAGLTYVTVNTGQAFDISKDNIKARDVGQIVYSWKMDNDSAWDVGIGIFATLANGHRYLVGGQYLNIHHDAEHGDIPLGWPAPRYISAIQNASFHPTS